MADRLRRWAEPHRGEAGYSLVGAVVGATYPEQLAELRAELPASFFWCPATGPRERPPATSPGRSTNDGLGALVNNSRGITYAYERPAYHARFGDNWQAAVEQAVRDMIDDLAANTNAGRLQAALKSLT